MKIESMIAALMLLLPLSVLQAEDSRKLNREISDLDARLEHARLLSYLHKYDQSITEYKKILEIEPKWDTPRIELAKIYYYQGKPAEALQTIEQVPEDIRDDATQLFLADLYISSNNYKEAESLLKKHLSASPKDISAKYKLAEILSWEKQFDKSLELYKDILEEKPDDIQIRRKYAMVLMWSGSFAQAADEMKKTLPEEKAIR